MSNATLLSRDVPLPSYTLHPLPPLLPPLSDLHLSLAIPIVIHWILSSIFSLMETYGICPKYRLHTSAEEETRNRCSRWECFRGVVINQIIQTLLGLGFGMLGDGDMTGKEEYDIAAWTRRIEAAHHMLPSLLSLMGINAKGMALSLASSNISFAALLMAGGETSGFQNIARMSGNQAALRAWHKNLA